MRSYHGVVAIDLWLVERRLVHTALEIVWNDDTRHAAEEPEHAHMCSDPVRESLRPGCFRVGVIGCTEHSDKYLCIAHLASHWIGNRKLLARVIDEHLFAGNVMLAHHRRELSLELTIEIAEPRVTVTLRMSVVVLLPQHHQVDARPLEFA